MKSGQLTEYNMGYIFQKIKQKNGAERLVPDLFLFIKALYKVKASGL